MREVPRTTYSKSHLSIGFGFSSIANDYKIVKFSVSGSYFYESRGSYRAYKKGVNGVLVYSLHTGLWKDVEFGNIKDLYIYSETATDNNNGTIIWLAQNLNDESGIMVSFDIEMEVFTLIPRPALYTSSICIPTFHENKPAILSYSVIGNSQSGFIHLWVVEENRCAFGGGIWTWTKKYSSSPNLYPYYLIPLNTWRNEIVCTVSLQSEFVRRTEKYGEALKDRGRTLYLLTLATNEIKKFVMINNNGGFGILNYVESIVPVGT
ncbi:uncharacterized protein LOC114719470 [Neltuma alba]|uniref:uncharacterized protein LOC114719470 n=1 Tax=Neltuma alba TaxID=207710 RepID=UPI0010A342B6|nr:uncharacterized protein LOC114719470 [Prosopis alba]